MGYRWFKIINQTMNPKHTLPYPAKEGNYVNAQFGSSGYSGAFGEETPGKWIAYEEALNQMRSIFRAWTWFGMSGRMYRAPFRRLIKKLKRYTYHGWFDVHAKLGI
jgi:hypothetical protein